MKIKLRNKVLINTEYWSIGDIFSLFWSIVGAFFFGITGDVFIAILFVILTLWIWIAGEEAAKCKKYEEFFTRIGEEQVDENSKVIQ